MPSSHERPLFPERDAEIVWLHKDVGWSRARIAKRHGISVDRVRQVEERWLRLEERSRLPYQGGAATINPWWLALNEVNVGVRR
jgi:predicted NACHT family NTPase